MIFFIIFLSFFIFLFFLTEKIHTNSIWHSSISFEMWFVICVLVAALNCNTFDIFFSLSFTFLPSAISISRSLAHLFCVYFLNRTIYTYKLTPKQLDHLLVRILVIVELFAVALVHFTSFCLQQASAQFDWNIVEWVIGKQESRIAQKFNDANKRNVHTEQKYRWK